MKKQYIKEQTTGNGFLNKAVTLGCINKEKYSWFTIDDKNPIQTVGGEDVVVGTKTDGKKVYFYAPKPGETLGVYKVENGTKDYYWECDVLKGRKEKFITDFIKDNLDYQKEEPSDYEIGRKYAKIDLSTLSDIFKQGERFIYKRINTVNTNIEQQTPIEDALYKAGYTLEEPKVTEPEWKLGEPIGNIMPKYDKYYNAPKSGKTMVWPMTQEQKEKFKKSQTKPEGESENSSETEVDLSTTIKNLKDKVKEKNYTKSDCRNAIKTLYIAGINKSSKLNDVDLLTLRKIVLGCSKDTRFNSGAFGVGDELKRIKQDRSEYGIATLLESSNVDMKKLIKENLIKTSEKKQQRLLSENTIIVNRYKLLTENINPKSKKDVKKFFDLVITETAYLHSQDYNKELIKESFFDLLGGLFGNASTGVFQYFKEHIATWLIRKFGFDPNSWLGNIIVVAVGNLPLTELHNLTNCTFVSKMLAKDIAEGAINKIKNEQGLTGPGYDILRNAMVEMAEDSSFGQKIEHKISDYICPKLQGLSGKIENVTKTIKTNALKPDQSSVGGKVKNLATKGVDKVKSLVS